MDDTFSVTDIADNTWIISPERHGAGISNYIYTCAGKNLCKIYNIIYKGIKFL